MARFGSSGRRDHIVKSKVDTGELSQNGDGTNGPERVNFTAWCGETGRGFKGVHSGYTLPYGWTDYEKAFRPCPKCQSKMLAAKLKAEPIGYALGERVNASDENNPYGVSKWGFKSVYPVIDLGILADEERDRTVAFICIDNGWGKLWEIHPWERVTNARDKEPREPKFSGGGVMSYQKKIGDSEKSYPHDAKGYASKEEALMAFPMLSEQGLLKTRPALLEADREWIAAMAEREAEREAERAVDAQRREDARIAAQNKREALITDIRDVLFNDESLSNFARDVLFRTAKAAGITEDELMTANPLADETVNAEPETDEWGVVISQ